MNTSVQAIEHNPVGQDADSLANEKERFGSTTAVLSVPKTVTKSPDNLIAESSREAGIVPPSAPSTSTSTSLTSIPPHLASETPNVSSTILPRSRPTSRDTSPYPRSRPSTPNRPSTPTASSSVRPIAPRRSARTAAKGPERPQGPPELEAALTIAIRNLESDIYEWWCANQKPGSPIPTTAYLKGRSPRIRRAAEAVDEADRLLNEAVYGKTRKGRPPAAKKTSGKSEPQGSPGEVPETAFGQLELNSQTNPLPQPTAADEDPTFPGEGKGQPRRSSRNKESASD